MINDFSYIFYWWFLLFGLGITFLPLTWWFFKKFFDIGYGFSKIIAILLISYFVWLMGSLRIFPFSVATSWLIVFLLALVNFWLARKNRTEFLKQIKTHWKILLFEETIFFIALTLWSFVRGFQPNIQGLEKFMDYGFINSILRSQYFPPADMWLAGKTINYYYFGHLVTAVLTKLSGLDSAITYNLMIATIFALAFTAAFSLGGNLVFYWKLAIRNWKFPIIAGMLTASLLTLGGNLHPLWYLIKHGNYGTYWYPDATRFIVQSSGAADNTIHEFPIYSFVVADLHGHLLDLPFVLLFISLLFSLIIRNWKLKIRNLILPSLMLAVFYMTNAWDFPIYFIVLGATIFYFNYLKWGLKTKTFTKTLLFVVYCLLLAILFSLPFHLNFKSIATGVGLVDFHSPPWMLLVLWGLPLVSTVGFLVFSLVHKPVTSHRLLVTDVFILILIIISWVLIIIPEFLYVKDIYIHSYQRANTMFKLTYQSFVMFSLVSGYVIVRILTSLRQKFLKLVCCLLFVVCCIFIFIYPYFAVRSYYGLKIYQGLYGLGYLKNLYPEDFKAILWLKENITDQPIIIEAVGESYTDFARVSANTGLPTILGWRVHEWLWRGSFDEPALRTEEVRKIYESKNLEETQTLLGKYKVNYIFVGTLERRSYRQINEEKFSEIGKLIFHEGQTKIYQLN